MMHADLIDQEDLLGQLKSLGFEVPTGARHFQGCYVDRDELLSRILVLQR